MNTTRKFFLIASLIVFSFSSCSDDRQTNENLNGEIRLTSSVKKSMMGKPESVFLKFESGDSISMFIHEDATVPTTSYDQPLLFISDGNGGLTPPMFKMPYFPQSGNGVNIYACYPWFAASAVDTLKDFTVQTSQNALVLYRLSDLMLGRPAVNPVVRRNSTVALTFTHQLSKINVQLSAGDGLLTADLANATIKLKGLLPTMTFNPKTGVTGVAKGAAKDITLFSSYSAPLTDLAAIIIPQTVAQSAPFIEVTLASGGVLTYQMASATTFESGMEYSYAINVKLKGLSVSSTITEWTPIGYTVNGDATMN